MLIMPNGMKNTFIEKIFISIIIPTIGLYITSAITEASVLSKIPMSLENMLISTPEGVKSK
jgi:hypothetical protein